MQTELCEELIERDYSTIAEIIKAYKIANNRVKKSKPRTYKAKTYKVRRRRTKK